jgi:hypothetical protein
MANFPPNETALIDQYLDALWQDPDAAPPDGLDHDLADFVRNLARAEQIDPQTAKTLQARVWQRALIHARAAQVNQNHQQTGTTPMIGVYPNIRIARKPERTNLVTFSVLAAAVILVLISTSTLLKPSPVPQPPGAGANVAVQDRGTPTPAPTASLVPTATPFPVTIEYGTIPPNLLPTIVPITIGDVVPTIAPPCEVTVDYGVVIGISTALPPTIIPPPTSSDVWGTATPIPNISPFTVTTPCMTTVIGTPSLEVITLDVRALKAQGLRLGENDDANGNRRFVGAINGETPYAYAVYGPGAEDRKWDISVVAAYENNAPQPDFSLIVFDLDEAAANGNVQIWVGAQSFNGVISPTVRGASVYFDADSGAGKDPELSGIVFRKGHRYGIYVFPGKQGQVGNFALNLTASVD